MDLEQAVRESFAADTCSPDDVEREPWHPGNPAWGHCDVAALVVHDLRGGDLILADVTLDGRERGFHYWNRLPDGVELDLTRSQFRLGEQISNPRVVQRLYGSFTREEAYALFRSRVLGRLE